MQKEQSLFLDLMRNAAGYGERASVSERIGHTDSNILLQMANSHGVFPAFFKMIYPHLHEKDKKPYLFQYMMHMKRMKSSVNEMNLLTALSEQHNKRIVFYKGIALSKLIYGDIYTRSSSDIDTLVDEHEMESWDRYLRQNGYIQKRGDLELPFPILKNKSEYYGYYKETEPFVIAVELQRYIHAAVTAPVIQDFLSGTHHIEIDGSYIPTFDLLHLF